MSDRKRGRTRRDVRLESLEGRCLLSVMKPSAIVAERVAVPGPRTPVSHINATFSGTFATDPLYGGVPASVTGYSGHGTSRPFGDMLLGLSFLPTAVTTPPRSVGVTSGNMLLITTVGGNQLRLNFTGTNSLGARGLEYWSWTGTVAGGTGRFTNATGIFFATGSVPRTHVGRFNLVLNIALNPAV